MGDGECILRVRGHFIQGLGNLIEMIFIIMDINKNRLNLCYFYNRQLRTFQLIFSSVKEMVTAMKIQQKQLKL